MEAIGASLVASIGVLVVQKLATCLEQEAQLVLGNAIGDELKFIKDEVESAASLLKDMSSQSILEEDPSEQRKQWLKQVKDFIFEAEDVIHEFNYFVASNTFGNKFQQLKSMKARRRIASRLMDLKLKANQVKERRERYNFLDGAASTHGAKPLVPANDLLCDPRLTALFVENSDQLLVGIAEQQDMIVKWLTQDDVPQLRVISIVGSGGMGKTTLATHCYRSLTITEEYFSCRAQLTVSQFSHFSNLLKSLSKRLFGVPPEASETEELVTEIKNRLQDKKYLVLLDDVWTTVGGWDALKMVFPDNGNGSRIMVTTRIDAVANTCSSLQDYPRYVHRIQPLSLEQSRELFCKRVFSGPPNSCPPYLKELMEGILTRCGGMPLAIVTIAGILVSNRQRNLINYKELWQRVHDGIGHEWEAGSKNMRRILMLSYNDLPDDVKPCFLYLSIFPQGWKFKRSDLTRRWIAEGLVNGRGDVAEQIAQSNFNELISRNLIDPAVISYGEVKRWKLHDLILDIIVRKASDENFVCIVNKDFARRAPQQVSKIRRIFVHEDVILSDGLSFPFARSLNLNFVSNRRSATLENMLRFKEMRLLMMLDLEECFFIKDHHVELICDKLLLLKHLCLKSTGIFKLPESIKRLQDLEVLDIRDTSVKKLPGSFIKLKRLSRLYTLSRSMLDSKPVEMELPRGIASMVSLRALEVAIEFDISILDELGQLWQLEKLNIKLLPRSSYKTTYLKKVFLPALSNYSLRSLCISSLARFVPCNLDFLNDISSPSLKLETLKLEVKLSAVPRWFESLHHLTKMSLVLSSLSEEDIRRLGRLPSLLILHLTVSTTRYVNDDDDEREISIGPEGFANLRILSLAFAGRHANLKVIFRRGALPNLGFLDLKYKSVDENAEMTSGIGNIVKLEEITYSVSRSDPRNANYEYGLRRAVESHANRPKLTISEIIPSTT